jgi:hypothetical protein
MTTGDRIKEALPATRAELVQKLCMSKRVIQKWVALLRKEKEIHIGRYRRTTGDFAAVLHLGKGRDAKRPKCLTRAQISARYRKSLKKAGLYEDVLVGQRKRYARKYSKTKHTFATDPLMALLYKRKEEQCKN